MSKSVVGGGSVFLGRSFPHHVFTPYSSLIQNQEKPS